MFEGLSFLDALVDALTDVVELLCMLLNTRLKLLFQLFDLCNRHTEFLLMILYHFLRQFPLLQYLLLDIEEHLSLLVFLVLVVVAGETVIGAKVVVILFALQTLSKGLKLFAEHISLRFILFFNCLILLDQLLDLAILFINNVSDPFLNLPDF